MEKKFLINDIRDPYVTMSKSFISLQKAAISSNSCAIKDCNATENIEVHHMRPLFRNVDNNNKTTIKNKSKIISGRRAIESSQNRKQIPLCHKHHNDWHNNCLSKSDLKPEWQ